MMHTAEKVIISTAVTGSVNVPSQSDYLPLSPEQVVRASVEAAAAGSAIIHLHARHPDGRPAFEAGMFEQIIPPILEQVDVVINISTGGSSQMTMDERLAGATRFSPELASLNMGSMNFVYSGIADKVTSWKHDWEEPYVRGTYSHPFINSFDRIEYVLRELGEKRGTRFEFECYDIGHLYSLAYFVDKGLAEPPFMIQGVFGILGGIGADHANLEHMVRIADKLFGDDYQFSAFAAGRDQMQFATHSAWLGGHVRVGLEDNIWLDKGVPATNGTLVQRAVEIIERLGGRALTPAEGRRKLGLPARGERQLERRAAGEYA
jgi:uncharacterized protein (DUF849 family)